MKLHNKLANIYSHYLQSNTGREAVNPKVITDFIIKHKLKLDDRGTIEMIQVN